MDYSHVTAAIDPDGHWRIERHLPVEERVFAPHPAAYHRKRVAEGRCPNCGSFLVENPNTGRVTSCFNLCHLSRTHLAEMIELCRST